jgi:uncharacterized membrane protein required for colicin V production
MLYEGLRWGVSGQLLSLVGWIGMLFVSVTYYSRVSQSIFGSNLQKWSLPVSFFLIAGGIFIVVLLIDRAIKAKKEGAISFTDRIAGVGVGALKAIILFGVISMQILLLPVDSARSAVKEGSKSGMFFLEADAEIYSWMTGRFDITHKRDRSDIVNEFLSPPSASQFVIRMR